MRGTKAEGRRPKAAGRGQRERANCRERWMVFEPQNVEQGIMNAEVRGSVAVAGRERRLQNWTFGIRYSDFRKPRPVVAGKQHESRSSTSSDCGLRSSVFGLRRIHPRRSSHPRHGLSLIEALISIFIVSIGLLGVVALFTIGHHDALSGAVADHAALVGREKLRDFRVRGMDDPGNWLYYDNSPVYIADTPRRSFCIDPPTVIAAGAAIEFPFSVARSVKMSRIKLSSGIGANAMTAFQADEIFRSQDDLSFNDPDDADLLPTQIFAGASTLPVEKRASDGRFSWMATVVPQLDVTNSTFSISDQYTLSIVVFHQRPGMAANLSDFELSVTVNFIGGGYAGGDATLTTPPANAARFSDIGAGQWMLVATNVSGNGYFQWYRLTSVSDIYGDPTSSSRDVTLIGADWDTGALGGEPDFPVEGTIVIGVVAVYEQTIRLKTSSLWLD